jgi:signal transduction histidine kinase
MKVRKLKGIVQEFSEFARMPPPRKEPCNVNEIISGCLNLFMGLPESIRVVRGLDPSIPVVPADRDQLGRVFTNLIGNAVDAMPDGGVLSIRCSVAGAEDNPQVVVEFADTGQGIKPEDMERLFEPFFTSKPKGTGLGLAVCHGIVSAYGGAIRVHGEPGRGARFIVQIPQRISPAPASDEGALPS